MIVGEYLEHHPEADKTALLLIDEHRKGDEPYYLAELKFFFPKIGTFTITLRKQSSSLDGARHYAVGVLKEIRNVGLVDWLNADIEEGKQKGRSAG
jgi:hypothetical protein